MSDVEVQSRLTRLLDVLEHERAALKDIGVPSLQETLEAITSLQSTIVAALEARPPPASGRRHS
jgi:hypothetical protein